RERAAGQCLEREGLFQLQLQRYRQTDILDQHLVGGHANGAELDRLRHRTERHWLFGYIKGAARTPARGFVGRLTGLTGLQQLDRYVELSADARGLSPHQFMPAGPYIIDVA